MNPWRDVVRVKCLSCSNRYGTRNTRSIIKRLKLVSYTAIRVDFNASRAANLRNLNM